MDSKNFKKRIHFLILKQTQPTIFFDLLGVAIFRVTLRVRAHIFVKMVTVRRNDVTQFAFIFPTRIKCDKLKNVTWNTISYFVWRLLQCFKKNWKSDRKKYFLTTNFHFTFVNDWQINLLANIYLFKLNNRNTRKRYVICPKLTLKTPKRPQRYCSGVFIVNF